MRIAVLGCGSIGRRHLQNLLALGERDLLAMDPEPSAREHVSNEIGVACYAELEDIWAQKPVVVLITTPTNLHIEMALAGARRRCHLFIEKPLSNSMEGVDALCAEVERRNLITMSGRNMRFHPGPVTVKRLIDEGIIGQVIAARIQSGSYLPRWRPAQDYRQSYSASPEWGGAILDCIHEIDLALWYSGPGTLMYAAQLPATTLGLDTEGLAEIMLRHATGALSNVHLNFVQRDYRRSCQIIGSEGTIYWDFNERQVKVYGADGELAQLIPEPDGWQVNQMYLDELAHFLTCVRNGTPTLNSISGAVVALGIALAARQASRSTMVSK